MSDAAISQFPLVTRNPRTRMTFADASKIEVNGHSDYVCINVLRLATEGYAYLGLGAFLAALPAPMALTSVELSDGRAVVGFSCTHDAVDGATDITEFGSWVAYTREYLLTARG